MSLAIYLGISVFLFVRHPDQRLWVVYALVVLVVSLALVRWAVRREVARQRREGTID
ncbi:hypothetical protein [Nocardia sp. CC227C]|uniref:hypothetical protein n=1 Tax=Nocardia sp. CC227C TaxID=3044562 RepID=UPI00278C384D|nr:hypothetical protein [Nocardia sp. CC227C]